MKTDGKIDYIEMPGGDVPATKRFYADAFGWTFVDYGPDYAAFDEGLEGGFAAGDAEAAKVPMPAIWARDLEAMLAKVEAAGGVVVQPIFAFPGGRRFHFRDPAGNVLAVFTDVGGL